MDVIREECSPQVWSRGVQLARKGKLAGKQNREGEYEVRLSTGGGLVSPTVTLIPDEEDWSCECPSTEPVCIHVAGAAIALAQALKDGQDLSGVKGPGAGLRYQLSSDDGRLSLKRFIRLPDEVKPLPMRLAADKRPADQREVAASRNDVEIDLLLGAQLEGVIAPRILPKLLERLADCDDVQFEGKPVSAGEPVTPMRVRVLDDKAGFVLRAEADPRVTRTFENGAMLVDGKLCALRAPSISDNDVQALRKGRRYSFDDLADLVGRVLPTLKQQLRVDVESKLLPTARAMPARISLHSEIQDGVLEVLPTLVYGDPPCARLDAGRMHYLQGDLPLRDVDQERQLTRLLEQKLGLSAGRRKRLDGEQAVELGQRVARLQDVHVSGDGLKRSSLRGALGAQVQIDGGRFDVTFETEAGERASAGAVLQAWRNQSPLVALQDGGFAPMPREFLAAHGHLLMDLLAARGEREDGELPPSALPDLARLCDALDHPPPPQLAPMRALVDDFDGIPAAAPPSGLRAELRSYQKAGLDWLRFLSSSGMGALLADDMGLGKTLQALCAMDPPALVVCPASVLFNWRREIESFRPDLKVCVYHGPQRALDDDADVTLTTYAIMRIDRELLAAREWDTVVLDEAQTIKNADSQVARAAYELPARFRVALTGTPVENRLEDLWSQLHFLNRGLLGGRGDFQDRYARPIADGDAAAATRLRARIKPFVLRRLKRDVAKELPPRTEVVLRCTLDDDERALYDSVRMSTQKEVVTALEAGGSVMAALEALLRLRQACCHRALLPNQQAASSSKLSLLMSTLDEALPAGHKALVFSQWTSLLDLVETELQGAGVRFNRLDGSTRDREAVVQAFQNDEQMQVMLLSLKAGGTGLNLTAADHVFLLDPWWNPAAEDQAADRAHRIGQDRPVMVHRLVAADSVEERILQLQQHKRALAEAATQGGAVAAGLSRDDLLELLR